MTGYYTTTPAGHTVHVTPVATGDAPEADREMLLSIMDRAWEQAARQALEEQLFDLDGRFMCLHRQHTRLVQVSQSQAGLLERIEKAAQQALFAGSEQKHALILDIIAAARTGATALREAMDAPIMIRRE